MSHPAQQSFFDRVKTQHPDYFDSVKVIDCGSLDVNGSFKNMFTNSDYTGVDIAKGKNVDIVSHIKDLELTGFDTVISGEMLEHDETWKESLQKMYDMATGLIVISCAGEGRPEHGTLRTTGRMKLWGTSEDYYMNLLPKHFREVYKEDMFTEYHLEVNKQEHDTYFCGIKMV